MNKQFVWENYPDFVSQNNSDFDKQFIEENNSDFNKQFVEENNPDFDKQFVEEFLYIYKSYHI